MILLLTVLAAFSVSFLTPGESREASLLEAVVDQVLRAFPDAGTRVEIRLLQSQVDANDTDSLRIVLPGSSLPRAHTKVGVLRQAGGGWQRAGWALTYVAHYDSVVVPLRALDREDSVSPDDLSVAWVDVTRFHGVPLTPEALRTLLESGGVHATRRLRADSALKEGDLRMPYAVTTGSVVTISYSRGTINLELSGKSRQMGRVGDVVRVYCPDTQSTYRARVVAPGTTQWIATL